MTSWVKKICKCKVCGKTDENNCYDVREMFFGTKEVFAYFECSHCHCMQIMDIPDDMERYYGDDYYSFEDIPIEEEFFAKDIQYKERILDVGCGSGEWLFERAKDGFGYLYGCDPFIKHDIQYGERIKIKKGTIYDIEGKYDVINFADSFEHMKDPLEELQAVKRLLDKHGFCRISMPVYPNAAVETFGVNWYQWDAPRHLFLHSRESMMYLCEKSDLKIEAMEYDSNESQFVISYFYELGMTLHQAIADFKNVPEEEMKVFREYAEAVNKNMTGDHAVFILCHK